MAHPADDQSAFAPVIQQMFPLALGSEFGRSLIAPGGFFEVVEADVLGEHMAVFKQRSSSVFDILRNASTANSEQDYLTDGERRLTYAEHLSAVSALSRILQEEYEVQPGDRVGIFAANSIEWVIAFWAVVASGAVVTAMNSYWSEPETAIGVELTHPTLVLSDSHRRVILHAVAPDLRTLLLDENLFSRLTAEPVEPPAVPTRGEDDAAIVMFTSGTTGKPKAVAHSVRAVIALFHVSAFNELLRMGGFPTELPAPPRVLVGPPFFHLSGMYGAIVNFTAAGCLLVLRPGRFDEERTLQAIESEGITHWLTVGSSGPRVAAHPRVGAYDTSSLKRIMVGGAPMTPSVKQLLFDSFPSAQQSIMMGYGSTEAATSIAMISGPDFVAHSESTGPVQDGVMVSIRDEEGHELPPGSEGYVHVRSPYTMLEYVNEPEATQEVYASGRWLSLGDIGRLEDGRLYLNSRARDLMFVSGENVYPQEVENRLEAHDEVVECAVAGVDDPVTGQAVKAFVVLREQHAVEADALAEWCRGSLPPYKVPTQWDLRTDLLPRNATGKILRTTLIAEGQTCAPH